MGSPLGIMPVVFGASLSAGTFTLVTIIQTKMGIAPAPSADQD
jgi:hypothetical protein